MSELLKRRTARSGQPKPLLGPVATTFATVHTGSWRTERPEVDVSQCVRCGVCSLHCPTGAIEIRKEEEQCLLVDWYTCKGCGICANVCPKQCVSMIPEPKEDG
jgi:pyruvate ferredoxin oxidoreductase delta subunit